MASKFLATLHFGDVLFDAAIVTAETANEALHRFLKQCGKANAQYRINVELIRKSEKRP